MIRLQLDPLIPSIPLDPRDQAQSLPDGLEKFDLRPPDQVPSLGLSCIQYKIHFLPNFPPPAKVHTLSVIDTIKKEGCHNGDQPTPSSEVIIALTDSIFRNLIVTNPVRSLSGLKVESTDPRRLSDVAPLLFAPMYARQLASRQPLLPTITKFLTSFSCKSTCFEMGRLRQRILKSENEDNAAVGTVGWTKMNDVLKANLWMTLANGLRDKEAARRLRPLEPRATDTSVGLGKHDIDCTFSESSTFADGNQDNLISFILDLAPQDHEVVEEDSDFDFKMNEENFLLDLYDSCLNKSFCEYPLKPQSATQNSESSEKSRLSDVEIPQSGSVPESLTCVLSNRWVLNEEFTPTTCPVSSLEALTNDEGHEIESCIGEILPNETPRSRPLSHIWQEELLTEPYIRALPDHTAIGHLTCDRSNSPSLIFEDFEDGTRIETPLGGLSAIDPEAIETATASESVWVADKQPQRVSKDSIMPTDEKGNRSSLSDVLGGDHLLWHMWKRRSSVAPREEDPLEMHSLFASDPDMKLLGTTKFDEDNLREDEEMLDEEVSTGGSNSPTTSPIAQQTFFMNPFIQYSDKVAPRPAASPSAGLTSSPRRTLSRGASFMKRLSLSRPSSSAGSTTEMQIEDLIRSPGREMEVKRRKTLDDYEMEVDLDTEEMLLN